MAQFLGNLLTAVELRDQLAAALANATSPISLASAYLKTTALDWVRRRLTSGVPTRILVRWQAEDLIAGSSDLDAYELADANGWPFFLDQTFHGKVYLIPGQALFVGSANLTRRGLGLWGEGNVEVAIRAETSDKNSSFVDGMFASGVRLHRETYLAIKRWIELVAKGHDMQVSHAWPEEIASILKPSVSADRLLVAECFQSDGAVIIGERLSHSREEAELVAHDLSLLGASLQTQSALAPDVAAHLLAKTKEYRWLLDRLRGASSGEMYFGALTAALHHALLDDPKPFRSDVKHLVQQLTSWIHRVNSKQVLVSRPRHSQSLRLVSDI